MKKLLLSLSILALGYGASAQETRVSIAANVGAPTSTGLSLSYGADLQADFGVAEALAITASAGYQTFSIKGGGSAKGVIPILGGAKFMFGESNAYGHAQLGYAISTVSGGGGAFAYAPSVGYYFSRNFDGSIKYLAWSKNDYTTGAVNLRLAYNF